MITWNALGGDNNKFRIVVCAAVVRDGQIVLQLRAPHKSYGANTWLLPGGKSNWGESVQECTVRELHEELGITVDPAKVEVLELREVIREGAHDIMAYTVVREFAGEPTNLDTANTSKIQWFSLNRVVRYPLNHASNWDGYALHEPVDIMARVANQLSRRLQTEKTCTGCGKQPAVVSKNSTDFCADCWGTLQMELAERTEKQQPPRFLAIYWTGEHTLGYGLYISKMPAEARAEADRIAQRNNWLLLRLDIQETLTDIYVHPDYQKYFPGSTKKALDSI